MTGTAAPGPGPAPTGRMFIGAERTAGSGPELRSTDPATGEPLEPGYPAAGAAEADRACALAEEAFDAYRATPAEQRAAFLEAVADGLEARTGALVRRAHRESGLPAARLTGEAARTTGQLRLFAEVLREGSWQGARIDPALPDRAPAPRPDIRRRRVPLGPVAVFGASNFPLAFSVAGGDTASALAAGCPVVAKAHEAHLGTSELAGGAIRDAVAAAGLPEGVFSLLVGEGPGLGQRLAADPRIAAIAFTGSQRAGLALARTAAERDRPIPVYAEMSAVNPVVLLPGALAARGAEIGRGLAASLTLGAGQFCTNPGLVVAVEGPGFTEFLRAASDAVAADPGATMLTPAIAGAYRQGVAAARGRTGVAAVAEGASGQGPAGAAAALLSVSAADFLADPAHREEVFGAASLVVRCGGTGEAVRVLRSLDGQLTATVHAETGPDGTGPDAAAARELLPLLERTAGRILFDSWPTGVEVGHAMVHGGPFPATTDPRSTSVGSAAVDRFLRPVAYQDVPQALLPPVLRDGNPEKAWRRIDGALTRD
ncbi:aldehyde dehydrogenase (NADP(+)) [Nocardiopsis composta]|uniref:NADP-dependent aldehyde dehydrogenase n=1 Tax=Nocardiopsis composta TaxID=157465 RepID=A0A7W8QNR3_9ACTN|nr:aldehyde dehydrogenase (NADP(+)) [Nocardiopsis composta]MBB5433837.1 NADP-dependent aldehyde dehydrogenase [Nocardiopsis composta]